jgi:hypothetical protein
MINVSVLPTHIILTTRSLISAWNTVPVAVLDTNQETNSCTAVIMIDPEQGAKLFSERNKYLYGGDWNVTAENVLDVYNNKTSINHKDWLPDDALIGTVELDAVCKLYTQQEWENVPANSGLNTSTIENLINDFCICQSIVHNETTYYYGVEECGVHGNYNKNLIESGLVHKKSITVRLASGFVYMANIGDKLSRANIYGYGTYINEQMGVYLSFTDTNFTPTFFFVPGIGIPEYQWEEIVDTYPLITLE